MIDDYETKSHPITGVMGTFRPPEIGTTMKYSYFSDEEQEDPCEGRLSSMVLWESKSEIPLPDPIGGNVLSALRIKQATQKSDLKLV